MYLEIIIFIISIIILWSYLFSKKMNLPPGPREYPIFGSLFLAEKFGRNKPPYMAVREFSKIYGPISHLKIGMSKQVIIEDIEVTKDLLNSDIWIERYYDNFWAERSFGKILGILFISGEVWKEMRRFSLRTLRDFGFGKQKSMEVVLNDELSDLTSRINTQINEGGGKKSVQMRKFFSVSVVNILWSMMAGYRFSFDDTRLKELIELLDVLIKSNPIEVNIFEMFPFLWHLIPQGWTTNSRNRKSLRTKLFTFFTEIIEERRAEGIYKEEQRDFIDVFLKEIEDSKSGESKNPKSHLYTDEQFMVVSLDLFAAGSETTSNTLEFAFLYMLLNPNVMKKVQDEIDVVIGRSRFPSPLDRSNMPYTEATLLEVQRMANVVPLLVRSPIEDTYIGEYFIPKETVGVFNMFAMHMDEKEFKNPKVFDPQRFLDKNGQVTNQNKILPFGNGKRVCLGESLARATMFTYFTGLLQNYNFGVSEEKAPDMEPTVGFTLSPSPYSAIITQR